MNLTCWLGLSVIAVTACERAASTSASPPARPSEWRCFARDPGQPALPQGDVTHTRQRLHQGQLEVETVHVQAGRTGATRLTFTPRGDHLAAVFDGVTVTATLHEPDASRWSLSYADPASGLAFHEDSVIERDVLTVTSTDPGDGGPARTSVRFLSTPCSNVVAELAKYPQR